MRRLRDLQCTLTLTRRASIIGNQSDGLRAMGSNWLCHTSMTIKVRKVDMIQYMDESANVVMVVAKSHFCDRVWSPLMLFHHEIP